MSDTIGLKRREDRWLMPQEAAALLAEIAKLRAALSWIEDQDPQIVEVAREKFNLEQAAGEKP